MSDLRMAAQQARSWVECPPQERQVSAGKVVAMLTEALAQPDVPEGYVLVPVEPTPEMLKAAVVYANGNAVYKNVAAEALRIEESIYGEVYAAMLAAAPKGGTAPDGLPLVVSGAIFDFAGYLTTRPEAIEVGATANAAPIADLVTEWAKLRGLSLDEPAVLSWQEWLPKAPKGGA